MASGCAFQTKIKIKKFQNDFRDNGLWRARLRVKKGIVYQQMFGWDGLSTTGKYKKNKQINNVATSLCGPLYVPHTLSRQPGRNYVFTSVGSRRP